MKVTARMGMFMAVVFAIVCFSVAITGFTSLGGIADPQQLADAKGFAWFWAFLGTVAVVFGVLSWWIVRGKSPEDG